MTHPYKSYSRDELIQKILEASDVAEQRRLISAHWRLIDDSAAETIKSSVEEAIRVNLQHATQLAELIEYAAELLGNESYRALALLAKGNIYNIGMGEYEQAVVYYADALKLYKKLNDEFGEARVKLGRLWAFSWLGRHKDAFADADDCLRIFRQQEKWVLLAAAMKNLSQVYVYNGNDILALYWLDQAEAVIQHFCPERKESLIWIQQNRAISLCNVGRFEEAIAVILVAREQLLQSGEFINAARASQTLATNYFLLGRYNEAIIGFEEAYAVFAQDQRWVDAMSVEWFLTECYLRLRRFDEVIEICSRIRQRFQENNIEQVVGEILVNEASAFIELKEYNLAKRSLGQALQIFEKLNLTLSIAIAQLEMAILFQRTQSFEASIQLAHTAAHTFQKQSSLLKEADAWLIAADSALQMGQYEQARRWIDRALKIGNEAGIPFTIFNGMRLKGVLHEALGEIDSALKCYEGSIFQLEKLRRALMLEHRAQFLDDKNLVFESAVHLCLACGKMDIALEYAERAKSRVLVDMLDQQLNLKVRARHAADQSLVDELHDLIAKRDALQSQQMHSHLSALNHVSNRAEEIDKEKLHDLEKKITTIWHRLLTINADYARLASLLQVDFQSFQQYIPKDTMILEYFVIKGNPVVFCVDSTNVIAVQLKHDWHGIQILLQKWNLNISAVMRSSLERADHLYANAIGILQKLYNILIAPVRAHLKCTKLIVVPHGSLHYAPFHAFSDGHSFLIEHFEISYLPAASLLRFLTKEKIANIKTLTYGNTQNGNLSYIIDEVFSIANIMDSLPLLDSNISKDALITQMENAQIIHLASHGEFHPDNPLFSGLQLADGWLTSLDVFNLTLNASLVTLSGCNTGRNHILGGDEVAGLMRAFLSAGAQAMLLSLWPISDEISAWAMKHFYSQLKFGISHSCALRTLQIQCIRGEVPFDETLRLRHPFYWAPYFYVGIP